MFGLWRRRGPAPPSVVVEGELHGYFQIRLDRVSGWATDHFGRPIAQMRIEFRRYGRVIASCEAIRNERRQRCEFELPIGGQFSPAELVSEEVAVIARDEHGNTGQIIMDGAAQLEVLRDHFASPCVPILNLEFGKDGNTKPYLGAGWSPPAADFAHTENDESFVYFDKPPDPGRYAFRVTASAMVAKPDVPRQDLEIFLDGTSIARFAYVEAHVQFNEAKFSHEAFGDGPRATLRLHHPLAVRPADIFKTSSDKRRLAVSVRRLSIVRLLTED